MTNARTAEPPPCRRSARPPKPPSTSVSGSAEDESCIVVTDDERHAIGEALYEAAHEVTDDVRARSLPAGHPARRRTPTPVAAAMRNADVFLARRPRV